ncbi:MAG: acyl--CoA ligase [Burkholderiaceae bacterium]|nr:acyl--CoA ligase [Burkholderiaceae bacterium]
MILVTQAKIDEYTAKGWWGTTTVDDRFRARVAEFGDREAAVDPPNRPELTGGAQRRLSWNALADEVARTAMVLHGLGLRKDDVMLVQLPNTVEQFVVYVACSRLGLIATPVPAQYREHELQHVVHSTGAKAALTTQRIGQYEHAAMMLGLRASCPTLAHVLSYGEAVPAGALALAPAVQAAADGGAAEAEARRAAVSANDVFTICWTSGTESFPKGVPRSTNEWLLLSQTVVDGPPLQPGQRVLCPFPMVNMAGMASGLFTWLLGGVTMVQHHPFDLKIFLEQIRAESINYTTVPPAVLNLLLQQPALLEGVRFDILRYLGSGSAPLSAWMIDEFHKRHGVQVLNLFGSNEGICLPGTHRDIPDPAMRAAYFPRVGVKGYSWDTTVADKLETRLVDLATEEVITEAGRPGEMRIKGPTVLSGYWRAPELTAKAFDAEGYFKTGDTFEIAGDKLQFYKFVGRSKDLVIRGGMNISPEEIETLLQGHPKVREVAVIGWPDETMGERVCACVVPRPGVTVTLEELVDYLRTEKKIAAFKLPERLMVVDELPRNPVGKVVKRTLRDRAKTLADQGGG